MATITMRLRDQSWTYAPISASALPAGLTWATPAVEQGQIVQRAYGAHSKSGGTVGDPFMSITDHSDGVTRYYQLAS